MTISLPAGASATQFVDALTGTMSHADGERLTLVVPAMFGTVLVAR